MLVENVLEVAFFYLMVPVCEVGPIYCFVFIIRLRFNQLVNFQTLICINCTVWQTHIEFYPAESFLSIRSFTFLWKLWSLLAMSEELLLDRGCQQLVHATSTFPELYNDPHSLVFETH